MTLKSGCQCKDVLSGQLAHGVRQCIGLYAWPDALAVVEPTVARKTWKRLSIRSSILEYSQLPQLVVGLILSPLR